MLSEVTDPPGAASVIGPFVAPFGTRLWTKESFNTWNHTQFNGVANTVTFDKNGVRAANNFGQFTSTFDPRILQLGGKIYF